VIAIPARRLARKVVQVGNSSGRTVDKFEKYGLTRLPATRVKPPLIAECFANRECKVTDRRLVKDYNLFILEVLKAWIDPAQKKPKTIHHCGYGKFVVDGPSFTLQSRIRSAWPSAGVRQASTRRPWRFSIRPWPMKQSLASLPGPLR
jgi:flavin reductase (DIM6/NTAB) family NADH-FMN oxidoreductase RutF